MLPDQLTILLKGLDHHKLYYVNSHKYAKVYNWSQSCRCSNIFNSFDGISKKISIPILLEIFYDNTISCSVFSSKLLEVLYFEKEKYTSEINDIVRDMYTFCDHYGFAKAIKLYHIKIDELMSEHLPTEMPSKETGLFFTLIYKELNPQKNKEDLYKFYKEKTTVQMLYFHFLT